MQEEGRQEAGATRIAFSLVVVGTCYLNFQKELAYRF
jgi:hypothetical protein